MRRIVQTTALTSCPKTDYIRLQLLWRRSLRSSLPHDILLGVP